MGDPIPGATVDQDPVEYMPPLPKCPRCGQDQLRRIGTGIVAGIRFDYVMCDVKVCGYAGDTRAQLT